MQSPVDRPLAPDTRRRKRTIVRVGVVVALAVACGFAIVFRVNLAKWRRAAAERNAAIERLRQIGLGFTTYATTSDFFPPVATFDGHRKPLSWRVALLPCFGEKALFD